LSPDFRNQQTVTPKLLLMLPTILSQIFMSLEQAHLRWACLRCPSGPSASLGDIDILVDPNQISLLRRVLAELGFAQIFGTAHGFHFLSYQRTDAQWLWLHIVTELSFGPDYALQTGAASGCLDRRRSNGSWAELAPDDAFWALLLHALLDKGALAHRHRARLGEIAGQALPDGPLGQFVTTVCPPGWTSDQLIACIRQSDWKTLQRLAPALMASWMGRQSLTASGLRLRRAWSRLTDLVALNWWRRRGLSVALLGPDGAGKSTLAANLQRSFVLPVRSVYMGLTGGILPYVDLLRIPGIVQFARVIVFWSRYLRGFYHQARGRLVLFDRYIYDSMVPHPLRLNGYQRFTRWVDGHACPGPDLVLILDAPGEVMYRRKGEYNSKQLEAWRQRFRAIEHRVPTAQVVDAARPADAVQADVTDRIWQCYAARWGGHAKSPITAQDELTPTPLVSEAGPHVGRGASR
jgi:thymidylate kinase